MHIRILLESRSRYYDGLYTAHYLKDRPNPERLDEATITIHTKCWKEPNMVLGTLLHEMIHQYQAEVLGRDCNHDAIFTSIARKAERLYGVQVRT